VNALSVETNVLSGSGSSTTPSDIVTILKTIHSLGLSLHVSPMAAELSLKIEFICQLEEALLCNKI